MEAKIRVETEAGIEEFSNGEFTPAKNPPLWITSDLNRLGFIRFFLDLDDSRPAREQFNERYAHGGGWRPIPGWTMQASTIQYKDDAPLEAVAMTTLRNELILVYEHAWVAIVQPGGAFEICRMD